MRALLLCLLISVVSLSSFSQEKLGFYDLMLDNREKPIGIDNPHPRFTWKIRSVNRNVLQTGYELRVATNENDLRKGKNLFWSSGLVHTEQSLQIAYNGPALRSKQRYCWQVRVRDNQRNVSAWSAVQHWEIGVQLADSICPGIAL